jgi:hypothetical protein
LSDPPWLLYVLSESCGRMKLVPFYSQIVNWNGENSGFPNAEAVQQWERNCCGIACLRMVLSYYNVQSDQAGYWSLLQAGLSRGAYNDKGWIHKGLLDMAGVFGLKGQCHRQHGVGQLIETIQRGGVCITSITACFLGGQTDADGKVRGKGGHLAVAYDTTKNGTAVHGIVCNHPSSGRAWNRAAWPVDREKWENSFSGNYVEFYPGQGESPLKG